MGAGVHAHIERALIVSSLSVILITKNEAANIRDCLQSVAWADEIIVVDSGSADDTADIAKKMGAQVYVHTDWPGFGPQKNRALSYASKDWAFSIDADERVTPELRAEIEQAMSTGKGRWFLLPAFVPILRQIRSPFRLVSGLCAALVQAGCGQIFGQPGARECAANGLHSEIEKLRYCITAISRQAMWSARLNTTPGPQHNRCFNPASDPVGWGSAERGLGVSCALMSLRLGVLDGSAGWNIARMNARTTYLKYRKLEALRVASH